MVDISRNTSGLLLPSSVSTEIWQGTQEASQIMQRCRQISLPGGGVDVPIITGDPVAQWVSETDEKPVSRSTFGSKNIKGYTLAVIEPFSNQFRRDLPALYGALVQRLPGVLARTFDNTAFGFQASPGTGFDTLANASAVQLDGTDGAYQAFVDAIDAVDDAGADVTAWVLSNKAEIAAMREEKASGSNEPLFIRDVKADGSVGSVLARPVYKTQHVKNAVSGGDDVVGFGGDWGSAVWGYVEGLRIDVSDQATLNDGGSDLNLWQRNMFAVRVEFEVGFAVRDVNRFVKLTVQDGS